MSRPPSGPDWVHEIKLDGYRMQLRVEGGEAVMRTRKGLDWTAKFAAVAEAGSGLADCVIDGEVVALDHKGAPDFPALQAALSEGRSRDLIYFVFDLLFERGEDLRALPLTDRKERLKSCSAARERILSRSSMSSISPSPVMPSSSRPAILTLKASSQSGRARFTSRAARKLG